MNQFETEEEELWAGEFGTEYIERNQGKYLVSSNLRLFSDALRQAGSLDSCIEFGANIGMNLHALKLLYPLMDQKAIEINADAVRELDKLLGEENVNNCSILEWKEGISADLVLIKGVLIHINPKMLADVYTKLYRATNKYILICEYYNPTPVRIPYRGHSDKLYKRDFAGNMLDEFDNLTLVDYGFVYHRDTAFPQDDITWFLLQKEK